jgi:hypothetical protein
MTSATIRQTRDASRGEGYWMIVFAATLLGVVGVFNLIDGIAAIANSHIFIANAHYVVGDLRAWGWVALILGALQVLASIAVVVGNQAARWFAVAVIGLNAIGQMFFIPAYPFWSLMIIALDVVALWGLCAYGSRENALLGPDNLPNEPPGWTWRQTSTPGGARPAAWGRKPGSGFPWRGRAVREYPPPGQPGRGDRLPTATQHEPTEASACRLACQRPFARRHSHTRSAAPQSVHLR